jgi:curved DNA-binding protein
MSNHYETLGVAQTATPEELKAAFRKLAKQHHPDIGGDAAKFQQINEAYQTLSDPNSRSHYDFTLRNPHSMNQGQHFDPFTHPQANPFEFHFNFGGGGGDPFNNIHDQIFRQFGFQTRQPAKNRNLRLNVELDLVETLRPQSKVLEYRTTNSTETIQVDIPAGIENNSIFKIQGRGDDANTALPRGDLEIIIVIKPHNRYYRNNENIVEDITIDCFQAITGLDLPIKLPDGKTIELHIPSGTQHQAQFGITDQGFPRNNGTVGKYIARINVLIPTALTASQLDLVKEIQKIRPINA